MYQMALEDVATLEADSKTLEKSIISNMKAKEATLKALRDELYDLTDECKALTCREGDEDLKDQVERTPSEMELAEELTHLEMTMRKIQNFTSVSICDEIFPRIKNQLQEKQWIVERLQRASQLYYMTSEKKSTAEMAAVSLRNAISEIACKYEAEKSGVLDETQTQQQLVDQCNEDIKEKGKMFITIRMSLQMLYSKLDCIRRPTDKVEHMDSLVAIESSELGREKSEESIEPLPSEDPLEILRQVMIRSRKLISHATLALNEEELEDARALFQTTVTEKISRAEYGEADKEEQEIMVDYDVDDPSVLTRAEIKTTSKKIVAQFEKSLYDF
ncbi:uncharacterized protein LOC126194799 [Schistocerca nitens]|nr:uncharacterized protein LOC126194799 [Schistocerca nitens]